MAGFGLPTALKTSGLDGTPFHDHATTTTIPGSAKQIYSLTIPANTTRTFHVIYFSCTMRGKLSVKQDGATIATARTAPGKPDINFPFFPGKAFSASQQLTVEFTARANSPVVDCEITIMATDKT